MVGRRQDNSWESEAFERFCKDTTINYYCVEKESKRMGKGDKKSKKGKLAMGSYGNSRKRSTIKLRLRRRLSPDKAVAVAAIAAAPVEVVEAKPKVKRTVKKK